MLKKKEKLILYKLYLLLGFILILTACQAGSDSLDSTIIPTVTEHLMTLTTEETKLVGSQTIKETTLTPTFTFKPISSSTLTVRSTWTPMSNLSNQEAEEMFDLWLEGSEECRLPCWAGISTNETNWLEAKQNLNYVLDITKGDRY